MQYVDGVVLQVPGGLRGIGGFDFELDSSGIRTMIGKR